MPLRNEASHVFRYDGTKVIMAGRKLSMVRKGTEFVTCEVIEKLRQSG